MAETNPPPKLGTDEVRAGETPHVTRYVLGVSLILIVVLFAWLLLS